MADYPPQGTEKQEAFLSAVVEGGGRIKLAAKEAQVSSNAHYGWMQHDPTYPERFEQAKAQAAQVLKDEAIRRAIEGQRQYKFDHKGNPLRHPATGEPYYEDKKSDALLIRLLEAALPNEFAKRTQVSGPEGGAIESKVTTEYVDDWYGNSSEAAETAEASAERAAELRALQDAGVRTEVGEDGDGAAGVS